MREGKGHTRGAWLLAALVLAGALAGCLGGDDGPEAGAGPGTPPGPSAPGDAGDTSPADEGGEPDGPPVDPVGPSYERTLYLTTDERLQAEVPQEGSVVLQGGWHQLATGLQVNTFTTEALLAPVIIQAQPITLSIWLQADAPVAGSGEFDVVGWFGSTRGMNLIGFTGFGQPALVPGEPTLVELALTFGNSRPLYVPAGEQLRVYLISGAVHEGSGILRALTGGETASAVNLTLARVNADPLAEVGRVQQETLEGTIPGNFQPAECDVAEGVTTLSHTVTVAPESRYLELSLAASPGATHQDLDMVLLDGDQRLMGTGSPYAEENILLAGPTLDGLQSRALTVQVYACAAANTSYAITVLQG